MYRNILFLFLFFSLFSCSRSQYHDVLLQAEELLESHPDSAWRILKGVDKALLERGREQAFYALLLSEALDKNYIDLRTDSVIRPAVEYYLKKGDKRHRAKTFYYQARMYENGGELENAVQAYTLAKEYVDDKDHYLRGLIYSLGGRIYREQFNLYDALTNHRKSREEFRKSSSLRNLSYAIGHEAAILLALGSKEEALELSRKSLEIAEELKDTSQIFSTAGQIAMNLVYHFSDIQGALQLLQDIFDRYNSGQVPYSRYFLWSYIHLMKGELDVSEEYFSKIGSSYTKPYDLVAYHTLEIALYERKEKYKEAGEIYKKTLNLKDSTYRSEKKVLVQELEKRYQNDFLRNSNQQLKFRVFYQLILFGFIILVLSLLVISVNKRKNREKREKEEYGGYLDKMREEYRDISERYDMLFTDYNLRDSKLNSFREALSSRLSALNELIDMASRLGDGSDKMLKKFKNYFKLEAGKNHSLFSNLQELVNLQYNGVIDYLKERYPQLTDEDLDFCCLIYLKMPVSGIQLMYNYTHIDTVYNKRHKLRGKLGLSPDVNLNTFFDDLQKSRL